MTKFQDLDHISGFLPNFKFFFTIFQGFGQISGFWPIIQDFNQISAIKPNFSNLTKFQDFDQISGFWQNFRILTKFQDFEKMSGILALEITQVVDSKPWVRCASGNVLLTCHTFVQHFPNIFPIFFHLLFLIFLNFFLFYFDFVQKNLLYLSTFK